VNDVFADTAGWAHLLDSSQEHHALTSSIYQSVRQSNRRFVTSNYVLTELVALFSSPLRLPRTQVIAMIDGLKASKLVRIVHVDETLDAQAWELLSKREDKTWSLVDCSSFVLMQREGLTDALTTDHHFVQAGFVALLKPGS
jgi:uncharacterized protein